LILDIFLGKSFREGKRYLSVVNLKDEPYMSPEKPLG